MDLRYLFSTGLLVGGLTLTGTAAHADTINEELRLHSSADTGIMHSVPTRTDIGGNVYIDTGIAASGNPRAITRGLVRFDLSSLPANAQVTQATLEIRQVVVTDGQGDDVVMIGAYRLLKDWGEGGAGAGYSSRGASWDYNFYEQGGAANSTWEVPGADGATDRAATPTDIVDVDTGIAWKYWNVTSDVQKMASGEYANYGWILFGPTAVADGDRLRFHSREAADPGVFLRVTYVIPEPATAALGVVGAAFVLVRPSRGRRS